MIVDIVAKGSIYGNTTTFRCEPNKDGLFELSKIVGRKTGTRPQSLCNKVYVETKEEALKLLLTNKYYISLTGRYSGIHRKSLRRIATCTIVKI
ncbi:hypothetical protein KP803_09350 [Vibrio sp. ZSDE26]|uniref:Uncharacterized protein n=1 Tax=Vibrio amylolyticus TaxID=2847292 RepID=A0A9X1XKC5_9VIBR|nr:hypothetical protein [Vibrio amylolyticus]MCK6263478.1 hypothetical protein [Vibrio amylolyticus]